MCSAGRVSMIVIDMAPGLEHVAPEISRALAVTTKERSKLLPDLPSLAEAGIPGYDVTSYAALFAPAGTPKEIVDKLNAEVRKIIRRSGSEEAHRGDGLRCVLGSARVAGGVHPVRAGGTGASSSRTPGSRRSS